MRRYPFWVAFLVVALPLVALVGLQFVWLSRLAHVSAIAHEAALQNYAQAVGTEIQYFYRATAARALSLPTDVFTRGHFEDAAAVWRSKPVDGARRLFLIDFTREQFGNFLVFEPQSGTLVPMTASDEAVAIIAASAPWHMGNYRRPSPAVSSPVVDERNPEYRIVMNAIVDPERGVVGLAGMVLDEQYFARTLLPRVVRQAVPSFFPGSPDDLAVIVRDGRGTTMYETCADSGAGSGAGSRGRRDELSSGGFGFVFTDWTLALRRPAYSPEQWAKTNFAYSVALSALLAAALLAGIAFALHAADKAVKLSAMKSDFVSNVSHELRTPLASIRVFAELLKLGRVRDAAKVSEYGAHIEAESRRLTGLINNILDFSRIESGQKTYTFARVELEPVVASIIDTFNARLEHENVRIAYDPPREPLGPLAADAEALGQAVHNLIDNAVKYSGGTPDVRVRLARTDGGVEIAVEDRGIGIPREDQDKIFDRFHRVGTGLVHDVRGSGLGLSIVRHVVEAHGGTVGVKSAPGAGSTFTIRLPFGPPGAAAADAGTAPVEGRSDAHA